MAELIAKIERENATAIGVDIIFPERDRTSPVEVSKFYKNFFGVENLMQNIPKPLMDNDAIFSKVIDQTQTTMSLYLSNEYLPKKECPTIHSMPIDTQELRLQKYKYMLCNLKTFHPSAKYQGFVNSSIDADGVLRRVALFKEYDTKVIPNFALAILLNMGYHFTQEKPTEFSLFNTRIKTDRETNILLDFYHDKWYHKVSAIDVLNGTVTKNMINGKIVIVGSSAVGLHDQVIVKGAKKVVGSKVHVTMIDNILNHEYFIQLKKYKTINIWLSLVATLLLFFFLISKRNALILLLFFSAIMGAAISSYFFVYHGSYISIGYFLLPFLIHFFIVGFLYIIINAYEHHKFIQELNQSHEALLDSMVYVAEVHDIETGAHILRTKKYVKALAEHIYAKGLYVNELSPAKIDMMYRTAPLHDLGKVGIEDAILKKEGKLTKMEYEVMKTHAELGYYIINNAVSSYKENEFFVIARNIARYHHEKWDGSGYPDGLVAEEIPIESRFMAIADVYDALVSKRVYKESFSFEETNKIMVEGRGKHFDPVLLDGFVEIEEKFREIAQKYSDEIEV